MQNECDCLVGSLRTWERLESGAVVMREDRNALTVRELARWAGALSHALGESGFERVEWDSRVSWREWLAGLLACASRGINFAHQANGCTPKSVVNLRDLRITDSRSATITCEHGSDRNRPVFELLTSGTTGEPRRILFRAHSISEQAVPADAVRPGGSTRYAWHPFTVGTNAGTMMTINGLRRRKPVLCFRRFDPQSAVASLSDVPVSSILMTPSHARHLCDVATKPITDVRRIGMTGEDLTDAVVASVAALFPGAIIENQYALTEAWPTTLATACKPGSGTNVFPADRVNASIRRDNDEPASDGEVGALFILATPSRTWVRTGDLACRRDDHHIELVSRENDMVSVAGRRVSLNWLNRRLGETPGVREGVVLSVADSMAGERTVAFVVLNENESVQRVATSLRRIAGDLTPQRFVEVDGLPINRGGKLDHRRLIERVKPPPAAVTDRDLRDRLSSCWRAALRQPAGLSAEVADSEHFFGVGGTSVTALIWLSDVMSTTGVRLDYRDLFAHPTFMQQLSLIRERVGTSDHRRHMSVEERLTVAAAAWRLESPRHLWDPRHLIRGTFSFPSMNRHALDQALRQELDAWRATMQIVTRNFGLEAFDVVATDEGSDRIVLGPDSGLLGHYRWTERAESTRLTLHVHHLVWDLQSIANLQQRLRTRLGLADQNARNHHQSRLLQIAAVTHATASETVYALLCRYFAQIDHSSRVRLDSVIDIRPIGAEHALGNFSSIGMAPSVDVQSDVTGLVHQSRAALILARERACSANHMTDHNRTAIVDIIQCGLESEPLPAATTILDDNGARLPRSAIVRISVEGDVDARLRRAGRPAVDISAPLTAGLDTLISRLERNRSR